MTIKITGDFEVTTDGTVLVEKAVDSDIKAFDDYFQKLGTGQDPLAPSEWAIIKTYLHYKIFGDK